MSQSTESSQSSNAVATSGSGESSAIYGIEDKEKTEPDDESSGQEIKRNYIPTEVFEKGKNRIHLCSTQLKVLKKILINAET